MIVNVSVFESRTFLRVSQTHALTFNLFQTISTSNANTIRKKLEVFDQPLQPQDIELLSKELSNNITNPFYSVSNDSVEQVLTVNNTLEETNPVNQEDIEIETASPSEENNVQSTTEISQFTTLSTLEDAVTDNEELNAPNNDQETAEKVLETVTVATTEEIIPTSTQEVTTHSPLKTSYQTVSEISTTTEVPKINNNFVFETIKKMLDDTEQAVQKLETKVIELTRTNSILVSEFDRAHRDINFFISKCNINEELKAAVISKEKGPH